MSKVFTGTIAVCALAACAGHPVPNEQLAASMAAVRGAETAGAAQYPQAALHMKLASEQIDQARTMIAKEDNEGAEAMSIRAFNDAELALSLAREAQAKQKLESYAEAHQELKSLAEPRRADQPLDATNPPGIGAPNTRAREAVTP